MRTPLEIYDDAMKTVNELRDMAAMLNARADAVQFRANEDLGLRLDESHRIIGYRGLWRINGVEGWFRSARQAVEALGDARFALLTETRKVVPVQEDE